MKTKNLIYVFCAALILAASCSKSDLQTDNMQYTADDVDCRVVTLSATIGASNSETKVVVDGSKTEWEIGDVIYIGQFTTTVGTSLSYFPSDNIVDTVVVTEDILSEDMKTLSFDFNVAESGGAYSAIYKYDYLNSDYRNDTEYTQESVDSYDYVGQNIWMMTDVLYIYEDIDDYSLNFNHHSTIFDLNFELSSQITESYSVKSVILEMPYEIYCFTANSETITRPEYFKLDLAEGTTLSADSDFRAVIPAYVLSSISLSDDDVMRIHISYSDGSYSIIEKSPKTYYAGVRYSADIIIDEVVASSSYLLLENMRAGELSSIVPSSVDKFAISDMKITGVIDDTDIQSVITDFPYVKNLDLSEAVFFNNILPSETFYYNKFPSRTFNVVGGLTGGYSGGGSEYSRANFETIILPSSLVEIGSYAFLGLAKLKEIVIPESVTAIGEYVFKRCLSLKNVTFPSSIEYIPDGAFHSSGIEEFELTDNIKSIGSGAFYACTSLTSVKLNNNITILTSTFTGSGIKTITIPASVETIYRAFYHCSELESIEFESNSSLTTLQSYTYTDAWTGLSYTYGSFESCTLLKSITLPEGVTTIGANTFANTSIETINIPSGVVSCKYAFANAQYLSSVNFVGDSKLEDMSGCFNGCTALRNIIIPNSVTSFGSDTFANCVNLEEIVFEEGSCIETMTGYNNGDYYSPFLNTPNLKNIELPNSVKTIGVGLFAESSFEEIVLGSNIASIGAGAFYNCKNLSLLQCHTIVPPEFTSYYSDVDDSTDAFTGSYSYMKLQVPTQSLEAYKNDKFWSYNFALGANIIGGL